MSRESLAPLLFIKHPESVRESYEATIRQFVGLIISAENEDVILNSAMPDQDIEWIRQQAPSRYERVLASAERSLSRGLPEQGILQADEHDAEVSCQQDSETITELLLPDSQDPTRQEELQPAA